MHNLFNRRMFGNTIGDLIDRDTFYNTVYDAINQHPSYVILSDLDHEKKSKIIEDMIQFYIEREDYERCARLKSIKDAIDR